MTELTVGRGIRSTSQEDRVLCTLPLTDIYFWTVVLDPGAILKQRTRA